MNANPAAIDILEDETLRVSICRTGAELISLRLKSRLDDGFLHRDGELSPPPSGWANHATVMGYFLHRLLGEKSTYRGRTIRGGNHGFLRHFDFDEPERRDSSLTYRVSPSRIPADAYPLPVGLLLTYELTQGSLKVSFRFENYDRNEVAHVSFGLHPGFAVASPLHCTLMFPAGRYVRHFAPGNFLDGKSEALDFPGGPMPYARDLLPDSYLLELAGVPDRRFVLEDAGRRLTLDFSEVPYVTIWSDLGPFICIEPCWGLPDSTPQKPFELKDGIQTIPAGGTLTASFSMKPEIL